ncbi:gliding motility-associated lipoprotein GldH [Aquiflexum balticum DSM 16537]|uniref:Gliding motility-associated lipoprotein GldH n=1 Tax=Aquiflexum balticum DSM 16537 TaxID=758820 RepID=A0A1W2H4J0_9BACT|nr:gliding motility lipoprotein GldH [Aquiflexum balticum]SMD43867.1 gliding motility-associated lipoprotein GldH [Aquiflexum balticum DSM 16537]
MAFKISGIVLASILFLMGCDSSRLYEEYRGMDSGSWNLTDTVTFVVPKPLPDSKTLLAIKYNNEYEFRNLYLTYFLKDSLNQTIESQLIEIPLFDSKSGKPLGKGYGNTFTKFDTISINSSEVFSSIQMVQYMRTDQLKGIESLGLKILKNSY